MLYYYYSLIREKNLDFNFHVPILLATLLINSLRTSASYGTVSHSADVLSLQNHKQIFNLHSQHNYKLQNHRFIGKALVLLFV